MCPIPNVFQDRTISLYSSLYLAADIVFPSRLWISVKRQLAVVTVDTDIVGMLWKMPHIFTNAEWLAKCIDVDGGIFEIILY
jgi:hypothetical protein